MHVVPIPIYLAVFVALMVGTYLTVWAAGKDFGAFNTVVALGIAVTKATLVVLFFMHVKYSPRLTQLVVAAAVVFLALLIVRDPAPTTTARASDGKLAARRTSSAND